MGNSHDKFMMKADNPVSHYNANLKWGYWFKGTFQEDMIAEGEFNIASAAALLPDEKTEISANFGLVAPDFNMAAS